MAQIGDIFDANWKDTSHSKSATRVIQAARPTFKKSFGEANLDPFEKSLYNESIAKFVMYDIVNDSEPGKYALGDYFTTVLSKRKASIAKDAKVAGQVMASDAYKSLKNQWLFGPNDVTPALLIDMAHASAHAGGVAYITAVSGKPVGAMADAAGNAAWEVFKQRMNEGISTEQGIQVPDPAQWAMREKWRAQNKQAIADGFAAAAFGGEAQKLNAEAFKINAKLAVTKALWETQQFRQQMQAEAKGKGVAKAQNNLTNAESALAAAKKRKKQLVAVAAAGGAALGLLLLISILRRGGAA